MAYNEGVDQTTIPHMSPHTISALAAEFRRAYDCEAKDAIWRQQSDKFRQFWALRILGDYSGPISDVECDEVIRLLDRNGKGNTKDSEAVARAMIPQGAWRRMLNELHANRQLGELVTDILNAPPQSRAALINKLYKSNEKQRNNLTGPSANAINDLLAAFDPVKNLSVISLRDRRALLEFLELPFTLDWAKSSIGELIVATNDVLLIGIRAAALQGSARTISRFCYYPPMKALWKGEHTVRRPEKTVAVTVPDAPEADEISEGDLRESMQVQALIARIGATMGYSIWLPKADRGRVLRAWNAEEGQLLDDLPLGYNSTTMRTIEQIDVIWLRKRSVVRAFEVEHTTSVYSGLLRMADLVALQPDINIKLHIVAPASKRDKVMQEIQRPVFSLLEGRALAEICSFLSYDSLKSIGEEKHLAHMSDSVIEDYEERANPEELEE
jgi:hypothetical protein